MFHNDVQFWRHLQSLPVGHPDLPSPRVCRLLHRAFERWKGRPGWLDEGQVGHLFRDRPELSRAEADALARRPVAVRKALAVGRMLELICDPAVARSAGSCAILPDELIVGTLPPFSVGQGKEFVRYLTADEELAGALDYLNELSPMGHIVPNHGLVLAHGLEGLVSQARERMPARGRTRRPSPGTARRGAGAKRDPKAAGGPGPESAAFYESVILSLEGLCT
jgi:hypothetical protein